MNNDVYKINSVYEFKGIWFLSDHTDIIFNGVLEYNTTKDFPILELWTDHDTKEIDFKNEKIILGNTISAEKITLFRAHFRKWTIQTKENEITKYRIEIYGSILIGDHYQSDNELLFKQIFLSFSGFEHFIPHRGQIGSIADNKVAFDYENPNDETIYEDDYIKYIIYYNFSVSFFGKSPGLILNETLCINSKKGLTLCEISFEHKLFNNFLIFFMNKRSNVTEIVCNSSHEKPIYILNYWERKIELPELNQNFAAYTICRLGDEKTNEYFSRWKRINNIQKSALEKYFSVVSEKKYYIEEKFLLLVQIFEDFHRNSTNFKQFKSVDEEYINKVKEIIDSSPDKHKKWLESKLRNTNRVPLNNRIHEVLRMHPIIFEEFLDLKKETKGKVVQLLVDTRNYMTHRENIKKTKSANNPYNIMRLNDLLKIIIDTVLFIELGFDSKEIRDLIFYKEEFYNYQIVKRNSNMSWDELLQ